MYELRRPGCTASSSSTRPTYVGGWAESVLYTYAVCGMADQPEDRHGRSEGKCADPLHWCPPRLQWVSAAVATPLAMSSTRPPETAGCTRISRKPTPTAP